MNSTADGRHSGRRGNKGPERQNLSMGTMVRNNSFTIYSGQIAGVFGLIGSGRTETAKVIAGVLSALLSAAKSF